MSYYNWPLIIVSSIVWLLLGVLANYLLAKVDKDKAKLDAFFMLFTILGGASLLLLAIAILISEAIELNKRLSKIVIFDFSKKEN